MVDNASYKNFNIDRRTHERSCHSAIIYDKKMDHFVLIARKERDEKDHATRQREKKKQIYQEIKKKKRIIDR